MKLFRKPWFWWCVGAVLVALTLIWAAYRFSWPGTGFQGKTVWDWLSLLVVPLALAAVALFFNQANTRTEQKIALDKQRNDLLQAYLDRMSELLLEKDLRTSQADTLAGVEVRNVARTRTISVLRQLDVRRVSDVFTFLHEAGLMNLLTPIIILKDADFSNVNWGGATLSEANLNEANLSGANLSGANLSEATLVGANLSGAKLNKANLSEAYLSGAKLNKADLSGADLSGAILNRTKLKDAKIDKSQLTPEQIAQAIWDQEA